MFKKEIRKTENTEIIVVKNQEHNFSLSVFPTYGAMIGSLVLDGMEVIDGVSGREEIVNNPAYKSTILAPFPNRVRDGKYSFGGATFQMEVNEAPRNNALHGFIYKVPFSLSKEDLGSDYAELTFSHVYQGNFKGYPFSFSSLITYRISVKEGFSITLQFTNRQEENIPFGYGWHPYFRLSESVDSLSLKTAELTQYEVDSQLIPTGTTYAYNEFVERKSLNGVEPDSCFALVKTGGIVATELSDDKGNTLEILQETGNKKLNFLQVYIPPHRKSIAIEPQTCCVDAFNNKQGYFELSAGETVSSRIQVKLNKKSQN